MKAAPVKKIRRHRKAKLTVYTPAIKEAIRNKKKAFRDWKDGGRPQETSDTLLMNKKSTTKQLRKACRIENAQLYQKQKQEIMDAKSSDTALFHKLVKKQRGQLGACVNELYVGNTVYKTDTEILEGWHKHFGQLAEKSENPLFDDQYSAQVNSELLEIIDICKNDNSEVQPVTEKEIKDALKCLNTGKSADIFGVTAEHLIYASEALLPILVSLMNNILFKGNIPDIMKEGVLTPVFKKKGSSTDSRNYRGITVTPTISKLLACIIKRRIQPFIEQTQNPLQRGFTKGSSPMNCSLILEEYIRDSKDQKKDVYIAFLDAKSAFDVVDHASLMRILFQIGVDGKLWNLIHSLHSNAQTVVRWLGQTSESFYNHQGVRQGGILSTDMYKVYLNPQLNRLSETGEGGTIGEIDCAAPTAADDIAAVTDKPSSLQILVGTSDDFSRMEHYVLQPEKSVVMAIPGGKKSRDMQIEDKKWTIYGKEMPVVTEAMHMGLRRSSVSEEITINENVKKSRRSFYSLMPADLQSMDPETSLQLYQTYVMPVLNYGLEVVLPRQKSLDILERLHRKFMKHILSLPVNTADTAIYILSGTIPIEGCIHKRALSLYGNICRLDQTSIEWRLAERQLSTKTEKSNSWFIAIKNICVKYGLTDPIEMLYKPTAKLAWKRSVNQHVDRYWVEKIKFESTLYPSLRFLSSSTYTCGRRHPLLQDVRNQQEIPRIRLKLKVVTGTYILQMNRSSSNQNRIDPTCLMCGNGDENIEHFILECEALSHIRVPILKEIRDICDSLYPVSDKNILLQIILDSQKILNYDNKSENMIMLEYQCRRLCFSLHCERYKKLGLIPNRQRRKL